jgi:hypothetical protein
VKMPTKFCLFLLLYSAICQAQTQQEASRWTAGGSGFSAGKGGGWSGSQGFRPTGAWPGGAAGFADHSQPLGIWRAGTNLSTGVSAKTPGLAGASATSGLGLGESSPSAASAGVRGGIGTHSYSSRGLAIGSSPLRHSFSARRGSSSARGPRSSSAGFSARGRAFGTGSRGESPAGPGSGLPSGLGPGRSGLNGSRSNPASGISGSNLNSGALPSLKGQVGGGNK